MLGVGKERGADGQGTELGRFGDEFGREVYKRVLAPGRGEVCILLEVGRRDGQERRRVAA